jgi:pyruvate,water dikinase
MRGASRENPPDGGMGPGGARFLFRSFQRILALNTAALERMAQMDRALSGEYIFDKAFLESAVRDVCSLTHRVAYQLNGMAGEGYVELYDAYLAVKDALEDVLAGGMGPLAGRRVLAFDEIGWEMEPMVGLASVGLAVLGRKMGLPAPDGLAVTVAGLRDLAGPAREAALADVAGAVQALFSRLGGARPLELSLTSVGAANPGRILETVTAASPAQVAASLLAFAAALQGDEARAVCLRPRIEGPVQGALTTLAQAPGLPPAMLLLAHAPGEPAPAERRWLSRGAPHEPLRPPGAPEPSRAPDRGGAWLPPDKAALLAELGLAAERALGGPCRISYVLAPDGEPWLTAVEPAAAPAVDWEEDDQAACGDEQTLLAGGQIACGGVAAGPVVLLAEDSPAAGVPLGSVGVARASAPALAAVVPRLAALLTETGTAASHLATVARENRVPAVFGLKGALALAPGTMVTVDAGEPAVYLGVCEARLRQAAILETQVGSEPEYQVLRRLLRFVRPLNLIDPQAGDFDAAHCRTCHDIIHFAHEKAVELLLSIDASGRTGTGAPRRLRADTPFELSILDLGGGLAPAQGKNRDVGLAEVTSRPLRAFLDGLVLPEVRRQAPGRLSLGDIFSGLGRTSSALSGPAGLAGLNLALAAADYANITMRLGYHFSVVDAVVSDRPEHTFIYFRFAGGFADNDRRARRAGLILNILERLDFAASRKGDLVVGKRKLLEAGEALTVLRFLGSLSAYTRQLDVELDSDAEVERLAGEFLAASGLAGLAGLAGQGREAVA